MASTGTPTPAQRRRYWIDLVERVVWTFIEAFVAVVIASGIFEQNHFDLSKTDLMSLAAKAALAGIAAVLALVKGLGAKFIGARNTAATLPPYEDTPLPPSGAA